MKPSELLREAAKNPGNYLCNTVRWIAAHNYTKSVDLVLVLDAINQHIQGFATYRMYLHHHLPDIVPMGKGNSEETAFVTFLRSKMAIHLAEQFEVQGL